MNARELEAWAESVVRTLRKVIADAEQAGANEQQRAELRLLVDEYDDLQAGRPAWRHQVAAGTAPGSHEPPDMPTFLRED